MVLAILIDFDTNFDYDQIFMKANFLVWQLNAKQSFPIVFGFSWESYKNPDKPIFQNPGQLLIVMKCCNNILFSDEDNDFLSAFNAGENVQISSQHSGQFMFGNKKIFFLLFGLCFHYPKYIRSDPQLKFTWLALLEKHFSVCECLCSVCC